MTDAASALQHSERVTRLIPGGAASLAQVTDDELLANTRRLVGRSNQLLAALLLHLGEVETRGAHRARSCASLYTYCIYELRFSEDAAARRSAAARFVKQFPALLAAVADGELHLTGLLMIGPYLTPENQAEVLDRARFRTKKELAKLLQELNPLPGIPDLVQPLGPEPVRSCRNPTWPEFVAALCPPVRELPASEQPRSWANDGTSDRIAEGAGIAGTDGVGTASTDGVGLAGTEGAGIAGGDGAGCDGAGCDGAGCDGAGCDGAGGAGSGDASASEQGANEQGANEEILPVGPAPADLRPITGPQRYQLQFETVEEHVQLIERAQVLMARERPRVSLGELHLEAMKLLIASLEKRKHATGIAHQRHSRGTNTRQRGAQQRPPTSDARRRGAEQLPAAPDMHQPGAEQHTAASDTRQRGAEQLPAAPDMHQPGAEQHTAASDTRQRGAEQLPAAPDMHQPGAEQHTAASDTRQRGAEQHTAAFDTRQRGAEQHTPTFDTRQRGAEQLPAAPDMHQPGAEQHTAASDTRQRGAEQHTPTFDTRQRGAEQRQRGDSADAADAEAMRRARSRHVPAAFDTGQRGAEQHTVASDTRQRGDSADAADAEAMRRARSRHVPAALRREVYERDAGRCGYVDARGERCRETYFLEVHHLEAFALGGRHRAANLSLRCSAHNRLAAERDFGVRLVATHRDAARHESLSRQRARDPNVR